ncbi:hypothetical protein [Vibrio fluvialis]|uniref:hypothetical protein n=1 Tax=Vibrio fluvialis TaxID=676 RepID=UPI001EEB3168|nr:hypothetical protein [Vibrio fluvialis]
MMAGVVMRWVKGVHHQHFFALSGKKIACGHAIEPAPTTTTSYFTPTSPLAAELNTNGGLMPATCFTLTASSGNG